jgi:hypothetical protein
MENQTTVITFWRPDVPSQRHSITLTRSFSGFYIRDLKAGGWSVRVSDTAKPA